MGLLDSLNTDEARMGLGLLAAGGYSATPMSFGQRVQMAMQGEDARKQSGQKSKLLDMQMANYESEIEGRKLAGIKDARQQSMIESLFGGGQPTMQANAGSMQPPASGMQTLPMTGAPQQPGQLGAAQPGDATTGATPLQAPKMNLVQYARSIGIPEEAIKTDMVFNGGKGIAAMLEKRGTPDMQVSNGFAYDKNKLNAGYLPSLTTSQSGQTSMTQIGPDGMPVVSAPRGALDTYRAYQNATEGTKAAFDPLTVTGTDGRPVMSTRGAVVQSMGAPQPGFGAPNGDQYAILSQELAKARASGNAGDVAGLEREIARLPKGSNIAPSASGLAGIPLQSDAEKTRQIDTAKADVVRDTDTTKKVKAAGQMLSASDRAIALLKEGPTSSGIGEIADKTSNFFGRTNKGAQISAKLDIVAGELTNNVPRMEGPQSDGDRLEYKIQAGRVADRSLPTEQRIAAAEEVKKIQSKYAGLNGDTKDAPKSSSKPLPANANAQNLTKGESYTLPNGVEAVWDGMKFKGK